MPIGGVSLETTKILLTYAASIHIEPLEIFNVIRFDPELLKDTTARISLSQYQSMWKEIAVDYLKKSDVSFYDISFLLGFSEQSSFNHAFKRWTGLSPKEYKNKMILAMI